MSTDGQYDGGAGSTDTTPDVGAPTGTAPDGTPTFKTHAEEVNENIRRSNERTMLIQKGYLDPAKLQDEAANASQTVRDWQDTQLYRRALREGQLYQAVGGADSDQGGSVLNIVADLQRRVATLERDGEIDEVKYPPSAEPTESNIKANALANGGITEDMTPAPTTAQLKAASPPPATFAGTATGAEPSEVTQARYQDDYGKA